MDLNSVQWSVQAANERYADIPVSLMILVNTVGKMCGTDSGELIRYMQANGILESI